MDVMRILLAGLGLAAMAVGQSNSSATGPTGQGPGTAGVPARNPDSSGGSGGSLSPVRFGPNGWPVGVGSPSPAPIGESKPIPRSSDIPTRTSQPRKTPPSRTRSATSGAPGGRMPADAAKSSGKDAMPSTAITTGEPLPSGMQLDSYLHDVFRATRSPGAFVAIGGVEVAWRLSVHGTHGEVIGTRLITHIADCSSPGRDRLERTDGRIYARTADQVAAHKGGIPYEALQAQARSELELFGTHLRLPWCFGKDQSYVIMSRKAVERRSEMLWQLELHGKAHQIGHVFGPERRDTPRDRFYLLYEPTTGQPRELVHRFASSGQQRRVLLEDWQETLGVRMPKRRIYVDEAGRPTTTVEMIRITPRRVSERDFRVL